MLGPFTVPPFPDLICSPVGLVPKKDSDEMRMIMHLSYPYGQSINDFIDPEKASTCYQTFDDAVQLVIKQGRFCWLSKGDVKSAFRVAPICFKDIKCLGICFETATTTANNSKKSMEKLEEHMNTGSQVSQAQAVPHQAPQPNVSVVTASVNKLITGVVSRRIRVQPPYSWINLVHIWRSFFNSAVIDTCHCGFIPENMS